MKHLLQCDFCSAEVELYAHYPPRYENVKASKIPQPLFDLAEALLKRNKGNLSLESLVTKPGPRTKKRRSQ